MRRTTVPTTDWRFAFLVDRPATLYLAVDGTRRRRTSLAAQALYQAVSAAGYAADRQVYKAAHDAEGARDHATLRYALILHQWGYHVIGVGPAAQATLADAGIPYRSLPESPTSRDGQAAAWYAGHVATVLTAISPPTRPRLPHPGMEWDGAVLGAAPLLAGGAPSSSDGRAAD